MTKIVYNACYGGFGLSDEAVMRYAEIAGFKLYTREKYGFTEFYRIPLKEYEKLIENNDVDGANAAYFAVSDLERTDPILVQVVEELGERANGDYAKLRIEELSAGTLYRIDEYDGLESVMTQDTYDWKVA